MRSNLQNSKNRKEVVSHLKIQDKNKVKEQMRYNFNIRRL
jgi:hypothetical protein